MEWKRKISTWVRVQHTSEPSEVTIQEFRRRLSRPARAGLKPWTAVKGLFEQVPNKAVGLCFWRRRNFIGANTAARLLPFQAADWQHDSFIWELRLLKEALQTKLLLIFFNHLRLLMAVKCGGCKLYRTLFQQRLLEIVI